MTCACQFLSHKCDILRTVTCHLSWCAGSRALVGGPNSASSYLTLWNCWASKSVNNDIKIPNPKYGPLLNLVGTAVRGTVNLTNNPLNWWFEPKDGNSVKFTPVNIYSAQHDSQPDRGNNPLAAEGIVDLNTGGSTEDGDGLEHAPVGGPGYSCTSAGEICCLPDGVIPVSAICPPCPTSGFLTPSIKYGCQGELWSATGRLPDWSYAGYMASESEIPGPNVLPVVANLKIDFGAVGDGVTDDTEAFMAALNTVETIKTAGSSASTAAPAASAAPETALWLKLVDALVSEVQSKKAAATTPATAKEAFFLQPAAATTTSPAPAPATNSTSHFNRLYGSHKQARYAALSFDSTYTLLLDSSSRSQLAAAGGIIDKPQAFVGAYSDSDVHEHHAHGYAEQAAWHARAKAASTVLARRRLHQTAVTHSTDTSMETYSQTKMTSATGNRHHVDQHYDLSRSLDTPAHSNVETAALPSRRRLHQQAGSTAAVQNGVLYIPPGTYV